MQALDQHGAAESISNEEAVHVHVHVKVHVNDYVHAEQETWT